MKQVERWSSRAREVVRTFDRAFDGNKSTSPRGRRNGTLADDAGESEAAARRKGSSANGKQMTPIMHGEAAPVAIAAKEASKETAGDSQDASSRRRQAARAKLQQVRLVNSRCRGGAVFPASVVLFCGLVSASTLAHGSLSR